MEEVRSVAGVFDHAPCCGVHIAGGRAWRYSRDRGVVGLEHDAMYLGMPVAGLADDEHPGRVRLVAVGRRAEVEEHVVAATELAVRRLEVRQRGIGAGLDERPERERPSQLPDE